MHRITIFLILFSNNGYKRVESSHKLLCTNENVWRLAKQITLTLAVFSNCNLDLGRSPVDFRLFLDTVLGADGASSTFSVSVSFFIGGWYNGALSPSTTNTSVKINKTT